MLKFNYTLENGKVIQIPEEVIRKTMKNLEVDREEAIQIYLEDEEYEINEEQEELCVKAKENKVTKLIKAKNEDAPKRTQKERVRKENPVKEAVIAKLAEVLPEVGAVDIKVENIGKLITFKIGEAEYKLDLIQKRVPKEVK